MKATSYIRAHDAAVVVMGARPGVRNFLQVDGRRSRIAMTLAALTR